MSPWIRHVGKLSNARLAFAKLLQAGRALDQLICAFELNIVAGHKVSSFAETVLRVAINEWWRLMLQTPDKLTIFTKD
jgi:hypothetical protein